MLNEAAYLADDLVSLFVTFLTSELDRWPANYTSNFSRLDVRDRTFCAKGIQDALRKYAWPGEFKPFQSNQDCGYIQGETKRIYSWDETSSALGYMGNGLRFSITNPDKNHQVLQWCKLILDWGMGARGRAAYEFLEGMENPARYLANVSELVRLETVDLHELSTTRILSMNSGLSKIHSLASEDGLIIYDSRVAAAIGQKVNDFLESDFLNKNRGAYNSDSVKMLRFGRSTHPKRIPTGHPVLQRDWTWMDSQIRCSWIIKQVLMLRGDLFDGHPLPKRMHMFEAALFMIGADITSQNQARQ